LQVKGKGHVVELGAGPGHVAAYLAERGVDVSALDLSSAMVDEAKRLFPGLQAVVGDMLDLPYANGSLGGLIAFYSIIHFDDAQLARAFTEMARVLRTGAYVALAFHVGDEAVHVEQWWDMPVVLDSRFLPVELVTRLLGEAGLEVVSVEEREPYAPEVEYQSRRAYLVAREPEDA
jgi:SAM-dependent methyltransferase